MAQQITVTLVSKDGSLNQDASEAAFRSAYLNFVAQRETEQSTIADAVGALFDAHQGTSINMPAVASMACAKLNAQPENYSTLTELVLSYVRENASEKREDGKLFRIGKGKGGGVKRWSEIPVEAPKPESK
jgi:hypothetical protein